LSAAWGLRYALFAAGRPLPLIVLGIALHGICFDFFFAAGFIHVENTAPEEIRASRQSLFGVLTYGLGMWLGTETSGRLNDWFTTDTVDPDSDKSQRRKNWRAFWLVTCAGVAMSLFLFLLLFSA